MKFSNAEVLNFLPHRDPFLFVDSISSVSLKEGCQALLDTGELQASSSKLVGSKVEGEFFCRPELSIFEGHFPGNPIFPGVCQVEMMAQVSSFLFCFSLPCEAKTVALLGVDGARFRRPIYPNAALKIRCVLTRNRGIFKTFACEIESEGELKSQCEVFASIEVKY